MKVPEEVKATDPTADVEQFTANGEVETVPVVIVFEGAPQDIEPFNVKSSKRKVPVPEAPDNEITIVTVPVSPVNPLTVVKPTLDPVVGTVPEPTLFPLIVMLQFWAPVELLWRQKLKAVRSKVQPELISKVRVRDGVPPELFSAIA